jgi:hypothetical protein
MKANIAAAPHQLSSFLGGTSVGFDLDFAFVGALVEADSAFALSLFALGGGFPSMRALATSNSCYRESVLYYAEDQG